MARKLEFNLPTIAGFVILAIIIFMLVTTVAQQFIPTFKGLDTGLGFFFIFVLLGGVTAIMILKKEFSFNKSEILPLLILVAVVIAVIYFAPKLLNGTMFEQSAIQLQSIFR